MTVKKRRRAGATETVGISIDAETKQTLKALAKERHHGNVSALITEMTEATVRRAAFERAWQWYGGPDLSDAARVRIDAQLEEGWRLAQKPRTASKRRRRAA
jgi:hypothetical protein